jgi:hypothetical protein
MCPAFRAMWSIRQVLRSQRFYERPSSRCTVTCTIWDTRTNLVLGLAAGAAKNAIVKCATMGKLRTESRKSAGSSRPGTARARCSSSGFRAGSDACPGLSGDRRAIGPTRLRRDGACTKRRQPQQRNTGRVEVHTPSRHPSPPKVHSTATAEIRQTICLPSLDNLNSCEQLPATAPCINAGTTPTIPARAARL